jgi:hypothetical protein
VEEVRHEGPPAPALLWVAILGIAGCSSPTAPLVPITVTGTATLTAIGETTQLTVMRLGKDVTAQATWQSSSPGVATVSSSGLVTAKAFGRSVITATDQGATSTFAVTVSQAAASSNPIMACGTISAPGAYALQADLSQASTSGSCLIIQANAVQLDCQDHALSSLGFGMVTGVTITNCSVTDAIIATAALANVTLAHNTLAGGWNSTGSQQLMLLNNHISGIGVAIFHGTSSLVTSNTLDTLRPTAGAAIDLTGGTANQVTQNTVDGGYDGSGQQVGLDDGIELIGETNDTVQGNTISNVFDAGIEGVDVVQNTTIAQNVIVNAGAAGIGSYYCTQWTGNVINGNSVSPSVARAGAKQFPTMMEVYYQADPTHCGIPITAGGFANNQVTANRFLSSASSGRGLTGMLIAFDSLSVTAVFGNLIQGNDLGAGFSLVLRPAAGFINGGGNTCDSSNPFCGGVFGGVGDVTLGPFLTKPAVLNSTVQGRRERSKDADWPCSGRRAARRGPSPCAKPADSFKGQ